MKVKVNEGRHWTQIAITPEDLKEVAELLRTVKNAKVKPVQLYLSFSEHTPDGIPYLTISIEKIRPENQINSLRK